MIKYHDGRDGLAGFIARGSETTEPAASNPSLKQEFRSLRSARARRVKKPTKLERARKLHDELANLVQELQSEGFAAVLMPPGPITITGS